MVKRRGRCLPRIAKLWGNSVVEVASMFGAASAFACARLCAGICVEYSEVLHMFCTHSQCRCGSGYSTKRPQVPLQIKFFSSRACCGSVLVLRIASTLVHRCRKPDQRNLIVAGWCRFVSRSQDGTRFPCLVECDMRLATVPW